MAKASIELTCPTCGKTFCVERKFYNRDQANDWERWAENGGYAGRECPECYAETMRRKRDETRTAEEAKDREADAKAVSDGLLHALDGTEKQVAWASALRGRVVRSLRPLHPKASFFEAIALVTTKQWLDHASARLAAMPTSDSSYALAYVESLWKFCGAETEAQVAAISKKPSEKIAE